MALDLAMDTDTVMGIVKVIPETEGEDFAMLKVDALAKLDAMTRGAVDAKPLKKPKKPSAKNKNDALFQRIAQKNA